MLYLRHSQSPILQPMTNLVVLSQNEIIPIPIKLDKDPSPSPSQVQIQVHGLPDGLSYMTNQIQGKVGLIGRYGISVIAYNQYGFDCKGFNLDVIDHHPTTIKIKRPLDQNITLGQAIVDVPILIEDDNQHDDIVITTSQLPLGVYYDSFYDIITGVPELPGDYQIWIYGKQSYQTAMTRFKIVVEGVVSPSFEIHTEYTTEQLNQQTPSMVNQIVYYTATINNTGNTALYDPVIKYKKNSDASHHIKILPNMSRTMRLSIAMSQEDLDVGSLSLIISVTCHTANDIKITNVSKPNDFKIIGHDRELLIKNIQCNPIRSTYLISNCGSDKVSNLTLTTDDNRTIVLNKTYILPDQSIIGKIDYDKVKTRELVLIGKNSQDIVKRNTYRHIVDGGYTKNIVPYLNIYCDHYHLVDQTSEITFVVQIDKDKNIGVTGHVKFYDQLLFIDKINITEGNPVILKARLSKGEHLIYGIYQGDQNYSQNGTNVIIVLIGDNLTTEQSAYLSRHKDKIKHDENKAHQLIISYR